MNHRHRGLALATIVSLWFGATTIHVQESPSVRAFKTLSSVVGEWKGMQDGTEVEVAYTLIARDTVLVEEVRPKEGPVMVTKFSVDGDRLLATHYCAAMNQPHMSTEAITDPDTKVLSFSLVRVTGLKSSPEDWHTRGWS